MTAEEVKQILGLQPHPREGGWYIRTWESPEFVSFPNHAGERRTSTAIYYLLEPGTFSEMHMLASDEIFHHYMGGAVEMLMLLADGSSERVVIGKDLAGGQRPQHVVPRGVWQGSRLLNQGAGLLNQGSGLLNQGSGLLNQGSGLLNQGSGLLVEEGFALLGCTVSPGFEFEDYQDATADELIAKWPDEAELISVLTRAEKL